MRNYKLPTSKPMSIKRKLKVNTLIVIAYGARIKASLTVNSV